MQEVVKDPEAGVRLCAAQALIAINPQQQAVVALPVLKAILTDKDAALREAAVKTLGELGPRARDTVPAIVNLLEDEEETVRQAALDSLKKIDPATAAKYAGP